MLASDVDVTIAAADVTVGLQSLRHLVVNVSFLLCFEVPPFLSVSTLLSARRTRLRVLLTTLGFLPIMIVGEGLSALRMN